MQRNNTEDKNQRKNQHNNRIDLQSWRFVRVEFYLHISSFLASPFRIRPDLSSLYNPSSQDPPPPCLSYQMRAAISRAHTPRKKEKKTYSTSYSNFPLRPPLSYCSAAHWQACPSDQRLHVFGSQSLGLLEV